MGEYAEMMIDGALCQSCGAFIDGEATGVPRTCDDCKTVNSNRAQECEATFSEAKALAVQHGFTMSNPMVAVYQLRHAGRKWIYNLYPKPGKPAPRIFQDPNRRGPFLNVPRCWTLLDVVKAAIVALEQAPAG